MSRMIFFSKINWITICPEWNEHSMCRIYIYMNIYVYNVHIDIYSYICMYVCTLNCMYVYICMYIIPHFIFHFRKLSKCRGRTVEMYAEGPRFKSPVCTKELWAGIVYLGGGGVILLRLEGNFPQHFGICEIYHKLYISREFSHQYMGKFLRKFNLYARMKLLLNKHTC